MGNPAPYFDTDQLRIDLAMLGDEFLDAMAEKQLDGSQTWLYKLIGVLQRNIVEYQPSEEVAS